MIQLKLLTEQDRNKFFGQPILPKVLSDIEKIIGYKLEVTSNYDPNFKGYYLMPHIDYHKQNQIVTQQNANNIFLLGIPSFEIPKVLKKHNNIAGLTKWRSLGSNKPSIYGKENIGHTHNLAHLPYHDGYMILHFSDYKDKENAAAEAIVTYLTLYDKQ